MMLVAEWNRLLMDDCPLRVVRGALHHLEKPEHAHNEHQCAEQREPGDSIGYRTEYLVH